MRLKTKPPPVQLRQLIDLQPHDLELYKQLAERMSDNLQESERSATSIIESSPNEAESHAAMAELRQNQDRWAEADPALGTSRPLSQIGADRFAQAGGGSDSRGEVQRSKDDTEHTPAHRMACTLRARCRRSGSATAGEFSKIASVVIPCHYPHFECPQVGLSDWSRRFEISGQGARNPPLPTRPAGGKV